MTAQQTLTRLVKRLEPVVKRARETNSHLSGDGWVNRQRVCELILDALHDCKTGRDCQKYNVMIEAAPAHLRRPANEFDVLILMYHDLGVQLMAMIAGMGTAHESRDEGEGDEVERRYAGFIRGLRTAHQQIDERTGQILIGVMDDLIRGR